MSTRTIPVISISSLFTDNPGKTVDEICNALETVGFFYITDHGMSEQEQEHYLQQSRDFFLNLPVEEKKRISRKDAVGSNGYVAIGVENLDDYDKTLMDSKEAMDICVTDPHPLYHSNQWPKEELLPNWKNNILAYQQRVGEIGKALVKAFSLALGEKEDYLGRWYHNSPSSLVRLLRYPPRKESSEKSIGCGAHSDYGVLTILLQDEIGGLQILQKEEWIPAPPIKGSFVINVGDCMEFLSNGVFKATKHRVFNNSTIKDRFAVAMFYEPELEMHLNATNRFHHVQQQDQQQHQQQQDTTTSTIRRPQNFGEHLKNRLYTTYTV